MRTLEAAADLKRELLEGAIAAVCGERNDSYGPPSHDFDRTARLLSALFMDKLAPGASFTAADVAQVVICVKLSRLQNSPGHVDSWLDIAGYAACGYECVVPEEPPMDSLVAHQDLCEGCAACEDPHCIAGPENCHGCVLQAQQWERTRAKAGSLMGAD